MKICSIIGLIALSILIGPLAAMAATTTVIDDTRLGANTYYGGTAPPAFTVPGQDVVFGAEAPNPRAWDIDRMVVTDTGTKISVKIIGPWFSGAAMADLFYNSGDLYLSSTGWHLENPTGSPHYPYDTFKQSEGWNYVVTHRKSIIPGIYGYESGV